MVITANPERSEFLRDEARTKLFSFHSVMLQQAVTFAFGLEAGALLFVSLVSSRTLVGLADKQEANVLKTVFPLWWPYGRDLMAPLGFLCLFGGLSMIYSTGDWAWSVPTLLTTFILGWTITRMSEDIQALRSATPDDVFRNTRAFCHLHHYRTVAALLAYAFCLFY